MPPRPYVRSSAPHTSIPPSLHASASLHLQLVSIPQYLPVPISTSTLRTSIPPLATPASTLRTSIPPRRYTYIDPPKLHTSTSLHLHRPSEPPYLYVATPYIDLPNLHTCTLLHLH